MATEIYDVVRDIPRHTRANCYAFALAPHVGPGGYAMRESKSQPGAKCFGGAYVPLQLHKSRQSVRELRRRILCDNPHTVKIAAPQYSPSVLNEPLRDEKKGKSHMMACICGNDDFHFCRRVFTAVALKSPDKLQPLNDEQLQQLIDGFKDGRRYVWVHQRGWSAPTPAQLDDRRLRFRRRRGVAEADLNKSGSPTILDADGNICWSPVPTGAPYRRSFTHRPETNSFRYPNLDYNRWVGLFKVKSRKATVYSGRNFGRHSRPAAHSGPHTRTRDFSRRAEYRNPNPGSLLWH